MSFFKKREKNRTVEKRGNKTTGDFLSSSILNSYVLYIVFLKKNKNEIE